MQKCFEFDINKCTGCSACMLACEIENSNLPGTNWRKVNTFNPHHFPGIPVFHISLACNHCVDAPCRKLCPALAYIKDQSTGAVTIDPEKCIGCTYCSWVCPYDAPKFNTRKGIMEKCTFCNTRLHDENTTACAKNCPTGALKIGEYSENTKNSSHGFPETDIKPAVKIIPLRKDSVIPESDLKHNISTQNSFKNIISSNQGKKLSLKNEWSLLFFTFIAAYLVGVTGSIAYSGLNYNTAAIFIPGIIALVVSTLHLGGYSRAYRAILNWRRSWISREAILYSIFLFIILLKLLFNLDTRIFNWTTAFIGFAVVFSVDMVYQIETRTGWKRMHSGMTLITSLFLIGILSGDAVITSWFGFIKLYMYIYRKFTFRKRRINVRYLLSLLRLLTGIILPGILWNTFKTDYFGVILMLILVGEFIDRMEFYLEIEFISPESTMNEDLLFVLETARNVSPEKQFNLQRRIW